MDRSFDRLNPHDPAILRSAVEQNMAQRFPSSMRRANKPVDEAKKKSKHPGLLNIIGAAAIAIGSIGLPAGAIFITHKMDQQQVQNHEQSENEHYYEIIKNFLNEKTNLLSDPTMKSFFEASADQRKDLLRISVEPDEDGLASDGSITKANPNVEHISFAIPVDPYDPTSTETIFSSNITTESGEVKRASMEFKLDKHGNIERDPVNSTQGDIFNEQETSQYLAKIFKGPFKEISILSGEPWYKHLTRAMNQYYPGHEVADVLSDGRVFYGEAP